MTSSRTDAFTVYDQSFALFAWQGGFIFHHLDVILTKASMILEEDFFCPREFVVFKLNMQKLHGSDEISSLE